MALSLIAPVLVKLGGEVVASPAMAAIAADIDRIRTARNVIVVHGGGTQTTDLQARLGQRPRIVGGRRITDAAALEVVKMVIAGKLNVDVCAALLSAGVPAVGLHGASALAIAARQRPPRIVSGGGPHPIDFGHVGDVTGVNRELLSLLMEANYVPVLACLGADPQGHVYNINADAVAAHLARALGVRALVLVSDVRGILRDLSDPASRIERLTASEARAAIAAGVVSGGMIPKIEEALGALEHGVRSVHVVGRIAAGELAEELAEPGKIGTVLVA